MIKTKIAICFEDKEYQMRFVKCFMHHYEKEYEVHSFKSMEEWLEKKESDFPIVLLEGKYEVFYQVQGQKIIFLGDGSENLEVAQEDIMITDKYQEVYKIEQLIRKQLREIGIDPKLKNDSGKQIKKIGIFSLDCESAQLPFCGILGEEYGEQERVLLLDLQMFSGLGLEKIQNDNNALTIEDLLIAASTGDYTKSRLSDAIGQEQNWEYIYPPLNIQSLVEAKRETYDSMLELLIKEFGYQIVIINFGVVFDGIYEWMDNCDELFFLVSPRSRQSQRMMVFQDELKRQGRKELLEQIVYIEMPNDIGRSDTWQRKTQRWRWEETGDQVRKYIQMGC